MPGDTIERRFGFENPFKPDPLSRKALRFLPREGTLLDVGCGEGADSVFFARRGFSVTALDRNRDFIRRFRRYCKDQQLTAVSAFHRDITTYRYPRNRFDVVMSLLAICCMKRSDVGKVLPPLKRAVKPGGIVIISARNYLDPELKEYVGSDRMVEPNTFRWKEDCCRFVYFLEKGRLREEFRDFQILYYYEGFAPCKYHEHPKHGDSYIICRRREK